MACIRIDGVLVVVARQIVQTAKAAFVIARVVVGVGSRIVVARRRVGATTHRQHAVAGILCGIWVVVQRGFIRAAQDFVDLAHPVHVGVHTRPVAVEPGDREDARTRLGGVLVVVARQRIEASDARQELARTVVHVRVGIVVASRERRAAQVIASPFDGGGRVVVVGLRIQTSHAAHVIADSRNRSRLVVVACVWVHAALAREVLARRVIDVGLWVVVARPFKGAAQHEAGHEFTCAVVVGGVRVVVAGHRIQAAFCLVLVAHPVAVHVEQQHCAVLCALLTNVVCKDARPVVLRGGVVEVASHLAGASKARLVVAGRTVGGCRIVVASRRVLAAHNLIGIAHLVAVGVTQNHHACAVEFSGARLAWGVRKHTLCRIRGLRVEVARRGDLASSHFQLITNTIAVGVVDAGAIALVQGLGIRAVKTWRRRVGGLGVVVARQFVLTTWNFQFVADAVAICIVHAVAVAVVRSLRVHTAAVVEVDFRIEVARAHVVATKRQT